MKLNAERLGAQLARELAPVYLIAGDEPLLVMEAADAVRAAARDAGFGERELMVVERGFDWGGLHAAGGNMSLFAEKRLIELRMNSPKPGDAGGKALRAWAERPPEDTLLLITCPKLDKKSLSTRWVKDLDSAGVLVQVWPVDPQELPRWIAARMQARGLRADRQAAELIAARVEGNLMAAQQEIEKLRLICGEGDLDGETARHAVMDSARFDIFQLADNALAGDLGRSLRILEGLRGEGVDPVLVLWALAREIRAVAAVAGRLQGGGSLSQAMAAERVWERRRPLMQAAVERHGRSRSLILLGEAARIDKVIKGRAGGRPWDALAALTARLAGAPLPAAPAA